MKNRWVDNDMESRYDELASAVQMGLFFLFPFLFQCANIGIAIAVLFVMRLGWTDHYARYALNHTDN
jgi:hypothetical protein